MKFSRHLDLEMPKIFISYRRSDTMKDAGRIFDHLINVFGNKNVFKDVDVIPMGSDFRHVLYDAIINTDVMLVLIGSKWLDVTDTSGKKRLDDPSDFVRYEVEVALSQPHIKVIPVILSPAKMPSVDDLPSSLQNIAYLNAAIIRDDPDFSRDMSRLISSISSIYSTEIDDDQISLGCFKNGAEYLGIILYRTIQATSRHIDLLIFVLLIIFVSVFLYFQIRDNYVGDMGVVLLSLVSALIGGFLARVYGNKKSISASINDNDVNSNNYVRLNDNGGRSKTDNNSEKLIPNKRVFISYKRIPNAMHANFIALGLEIKGIDVFIQGNRIKVG